MLKTVSSITNAIGALNFKGTWNASTNTPTIVSGAGVKGDYFVVSVAGSTTIDGISNWGVGDWITYNGTVWQRVEGGADLNGVNLSFTGTASGPTYETSNLASGLTMADNEIDADGTDTNIDVIVNPKGTGGLGVGGNTTGVVAGNTITSKFCVKHEGANQTGGFVHINNTTAASGAGIFACRSRGTLAAPTIVQDNDNLATISFAGGDGVDLALAARISVEVDGTPGSNDMPGRIVFLTTPDGSQTPAEVLRLNNAQIATFAKTIGVGGAAGAASGAGITFPATANLSTDPNTLDDYEEGTWTPSITGLTLGNASGPVFNYVKVGNIVTVTLGFVWGSTTSSSGVWEFSVPFAASTGGGGTAYALDAGTAEYMLSAGIASVSFAGVKIGTTTTGFVSNTAPFTWAVNDRFACCVTYRV
jgi:hypothetical protein